MRRRQAAVLLFGLALTGLGVAAGSAATDRWRIAYDQQEETCLPPYRVFAINLGDVTPQRDDILAFKAKNTQLFDDGTVFIKKAVGIAGDLVEVNEHGVSIRGVDYPYTARALERLGFDPAARVGSYTLAAGELFFVGTTPTSYDSRYYGPVHQAQVAGRSTPLW